MPKRVRPLCRGVIRLSGGSAVVVDSAPLRRLRRRAFENLGAGGLMFLDKLEDLFPFLQIWRAYGFPGGSNGQTWMVSEVVDGTASWSAADVEALRAGLASGPIAAVLQDELDRIVFVRGLLTDCAIMEPLPKHRLPRGVQ